MSRVEAILRISGIKLGAAFWRGWATLDDVQQNMLAQAILKAVEEPTK